ncbi:MAG: PP2C family protein-serine/threonine phosphatase, partial [Bacteroidota bacterium]|nr:PP2C family protein-serine/threonine phosphatase [Bacteroidota bacterium]
MDQRKLYKTVENIASKSFNSETEMLISTLNQLISFTAINVTGGRIWKIDKERGIYTLLYQTGNVDEINPDFTLNFTEYPIFEVITRERTILDTETNIILRSKGILKYSATGVGDKIKVNAKQYYEYLLALNTTNFTEEQKITLNIIATAITSQIKQKRYSLRAKMLKADINKAYELQKSILPEHEYKFHNYELYGISDPAEIVGGDLFDYLTVGDDEDRLGVAVGDAASKGVSAAAEAMYISGALRMATNFEIKIYPLMKRMNALVNKIFSDDRFASLFYGELSNDAGGLFLYSNAGHNPPIFIKNSLNKVMTLDTTGPLLGPSPLAKYTVENINFEKGDVLLIYTDGITDSADSNFDNYGEER